VTIRKTLVKQERKLSQQRINAPSLGRILHRVAYKSNPETGQSIMIPVRSTIRSSKLFDFPCNYLFSVILSVACQGEPGETKVTPVTKLFTWKIPIVEEAQKLAVIHRTSASGILFWGNKLFAGPTRTRAA
jgi:hypothetical protein